jgi:hypothetical protein
MSALVFIQTLGGTIFLSIAQNVFQSNLVERLQVDVPEVDPNVVIGAGASGLVDSMRKLYSDSAVAGILNAYNKALQQVFLISLVLACLSVFGSAFMEWKSVKKDKKDKEELGSEAQGLGTSEATDENKASNKSDASAV